MYSQTLPLRLLLHQRNGRSQSRRPYKTIVCKPTFSVLLTPGGRCQQFAAELGGRGGVIDRQTNRERQTEKQRVTDRQRQRQTNRETQKEREMWTVKKDGV